MSSDGMSLERKDGTVDCSCGEHLMSYGLSRYVEVFYVGTSFVDGRSFEAALKAKLEDAEVYVSRRVKKKVSCEMYGVEDKVPTPYDGRDYHVVVRLSQAVWCRSWHGCWRDVFDLDGDHTILYFSPLEERFVDLVQDYMERDDALEEGRLFGARFDVEHELKEIKLEECGKVPRGTDEEVL